MKKEPLNKSKSTSTDISDDFFNYKNHAKRELSLLFPFPDETQRKEIECIINMMEIVDDITNFEMRYAPLLPYLFRQKPISPLTGNNDEWLEDDVKKGLPMIVNKRASNVVKHNGKAFLLDGKLFSDDGGKTFQITEDSAVEIESFPFQVPFAPEFIINPTPDEISAQKKKMEIKSVTI
jgi:hypothetical protein